MKIALFADGIYPFVVGGMQKHSYYLAKYLAKNGVFVDLYHCVPYGKPLVELLEGFTEEELSFIQNFSFNFPKASKYPGHYIVESYEYSKIIYSTFLKNRNVDFVYAQGFSGWYYAKQRVADKTLPPVGVNFHGLEMFQKAASFRNKLEQFIFRIPVKNVLENSDYAFSLGGKLTPILENLINSSQKVIVQSIGIGRNWLIDENKLYSQKNSRVRKFVFVGRYERRKGIEELSEVLNIIKSTHDFEFHFIGPIPESNRVSSNKVIYHGLVREEGKIKELLRETDILVSPSYSEGMPTVILEAMASGCAVIASDVGAVCDEVDDKNGWLVRAGDKKILQETLVKSINMSDENLLLKKKISLKRVREKFLWDDVACKTIEFIYTSVTIR